MRLYIVRHGETRENLQKILQGHLPGTLTAQGIEQAHQAARRLTDKGEHYSMIVTSDLKRTLDTSRIIKEMIDIPIVATGLLRERDWGESTGMPISEARDRYYHNGQWQFPPSAETEDEIYNRAERALDMLSKQAQDCASLIVVTHGQLARNLIAAHFKCRPSEITPLVNGEIRLLAIDTSTQ